VIQPSNSPCKKYLKYSDDGYVRLTYLQFCDLRFSKRCAVSDDDLRRELLAQDIPAHCAGYCDWLDDSTAVQVSVGWAWFSAADYAPRIMAPGGMSSNVMLICPDGSDLGPATTDELLRAWLSTRIWDAETHFDYLGRSESDSVSVH
jgi:hypothetical protein